MELGLICGSRRSTGTPELQTRTPKMINTEMGVSENRGPKDGTLNSRTLIIRIPK